MDKLIVIAMMLAVAMTGYAQQENSSTRVDSTLAVVDSTLAAIDSTLSTINVKALADSTRELLRDTTSVVVNKKEKKEKVKRDWSTWTPDPQRALWLALVLPGAGQIYKYWKLPIIYGGFMGCIYALTWNNMMYKDYSQAYLDIMDNDPTTASYNKFLHLGRQIDMNNEQQVKRYQELFKSRKDKYRRWRDMSFFVMLGVYAISVIDAYVDAELSVFDISKDLSLKVEPTIIPNRMGGNPLQAQSVGVNCSLNF